MCLRIEGGTNVSNSPSIEYISQVLLPLLHSKVGLPQIKTTVHKRGWSIGHAGRGSVTFDFQPLKRPFKIPAFKMMQRGAITKVYVSILAPDAKAHEIIKAKVTEGMDDHLPHVQIEYSVVEISGDLKRLYLLIVAETETGYRLGCDSLLGGIVPKNARRKSKTANCQAAEQAEWLATKVVEDLKREIAHGGCIDTHMQDQIVVFQALADGRSEIDCGSLEATLHTETAR